jgi:diguanylate cyclase (GGDEF)-like protein
MREVDLSRVFKKTTGAVIVSMIAVLGLQMLVMFGLGEGVRRSTYLLGLIGPFFIIAPLAWRIFYRDAQLKIANSHIAKAHEELKARSRMDFMTGLLNRETFFAHVTEAKQRNDQGLLLVIDADHFKSINDNFGHAAGDEALRIISAAIKTTVGTSGFTGRIGGEEFAVYLPGVGYIESLLVAERVRSCIAFQPFEPVVGTGHSLTVSIGGALAEVYETVAEMMQAADQSLYAAKAAGRNRVILHKKLALVA